MTIDPIMYANLILSAIAVILILILAAIVLILLHMRSLPPKIKEKAEDKESNKKIENDKKTKDKEVAEPSTLYKSESIEENLMEIFRQYKLTSFTMATIDGLVISSTESYPDEDAANYSYMYLQGSQPESPYIKLIGVPYKGGTVVGIIKSENELSENDITLIERDIRYILRKNM
ncbi:hypothetical protein [Methanoplanus endosymbiosus]|uniref:Uncharacterized protein n=1 Tax=Methanoplanus endosymbiosus TaxID=33865 RepID=A0A9E7PTF7_9EURY|nr:hypothetical protein [Methanoplanus endosymbiosus]UUX93607.1 hypothetical protein L6E24_05675 [Methanoplanus endosymbiosus]